MVWSRLLRSVATALAVSSAVLLAPAAVRADADLVSTSEALALEAEDDPRTIVDRYLARDEVAAELVELGVDPEVARLRAAALSDDELAELAGRIGRAPAGGSALTVLGITFLVLLVLELVGVIDIFKKV
jgi:hypothetical protein